MTERTREDFDKLSPNGAYGASFSQQRRLQLLERGCAVADAVPQVRVHLTEAFVIAQGHEHRIVAEAADAARRPNERAVDPALEALDMPVGPGDAQRAGEEGIAAGFRSGAFQMLLDQP